MTGVQTCASSDLHPKYGTGIVTSEDDMMVEVEFPNYGKKQFIKAFQEVEMIR